MAHPVVHLELHTGDLQGARELYGELCGWRMGARRGPYVGLAMGDGLGGGIVECEAPRALWLPYAQVPEIGSATERAVALGASVLLAPREGPAGFRSVVRTAAGGELAFWQQKR